jgi:hypothetical protein
VTIALDQRATLADVEEATRLALKAAADEYEQAPARLKAAILEAARAGDKPAAIARAIGYVYTYDYVARIIRLDRSENPGEYAAAES